MRCAQRRNAVAYATSATTESSSLQSSCNCGRAAALFVESGRHCPTTGSCWTKDLKKPNKMNFLTAQFRLPFASETPKEATTPRSRQSYRNSVSMIAAGRCSVELSLLSVRSYSSGWSPETSQTEYPQRMCARQRLGLSLRFYPRGNSGSRVVGTTLAPTPTPRIKKMRSNGLRSRSAWRGFITPARTAAVLGMG